jgi:nitrous oxidase accessory protein NosD
MLGAEPMIGTAWRWRIGLVVLLVAATVSIHWIGPRRPNALDARAAEELLVTSSADFGPGSLREALFAAARVHGRARIRLAVAHIDLETPLPPASQPSAVIIDTDLHTVIDARTLSGGGAVLDIQSPRALLRNVTVAHAAGIAFLLRAEDVELDGISAFDSDIGIAIVGNAPYVDIRNCTMARNRLGLQLATAVAGIVHSCKFSQHGENAVWAVQPVTGAPARTPLKIIDNVFTADRDAVVVANLPVTVEHNQFDKSLRNSITVLGSEVTLRGNRIQGAVGNGIFIDGADRVVITDNEIGNSPGTAIMLNSSARVSVDHNRIYGNAYGIVQVLGKKDAPLTLAHNLIFSQRLDGLLIIGASPVVSDNRSINNAGAGIKVLNVVRQGRVSVEAAPLLDRNETAGNTIGDVVRGSYPL